MLYDVLVEKFSKVVAELNQAQKMSEEQKKRKDLSAEDK